MFAGHHGGSFRTANGQQKDTLLYLSDLRNCFEKNLTHDDVERDIESLEL